MQTDKTTEAVAVTDTAAADASPTTSRSPCHTLRRLSIAHENAF